MHYFSFEISNAPDWCEDVRRCRTGLNPHFLFVLPKRLPGFPAELYRFGTEKPRRGISISPRTPLKRHKGAGCGPNTVMAIRFPALMGRQSCHFLESGPLHPPLAALSPLSPIPPRGTKGRDCGPSPLETPPGDEGRGRKNQPPRGRRARDEDKAENGPGSA